MPLQAMSGRRAAISSAPVADGFCRLVHDHHTGEDAGLFPAVRRSAPHLGAVVDRLEADHRTVARLIDAVSTAANRLDDDEPDAARAGLAAALTELSAQLLDHLGREEEALEPVLATWPAWPAQEAPAR